MPRMKAALERASHYMPIAPDAAQIAAPHIIYSVKTFIALLRYPVNSADILGIINDTKLYSMHKLNRL